MAYSNHGPIRRVRPWLALVLLLAVVALCGLTSQQAWGQCDLQADEVKPLIQVLRESELRKRDPDRAKQAITGLGELRCAAAADDLAALLTFRYRFDWEGTQIRLQPIFTATRYPATSALAQIGEASLPALVRVIKENPPNSLMTRNATYTAKWIFRDHPGKAESYLIEAAERAATAESRSRLRQAAAAVPNIPLVDVKRYSNSASH